MHVLPTLKQIMLQLARLAWPLLNILGPNNPKPNKPKQNKSGPNNLRPNNPGLNKAWTKHGRAKQSQIKQA